MCESFTLPPRKRLLRNFRRKKATKKVPTMSTRESRAVLGWFRIGPSVRTRLSELVGSGTGEPGETG